MDGNGAPLNQSHVEGRMKKKRRSSGTSFVSPSPKPNPNYNQNPNSPDPSQAAPTIHQFLANRDAFHFLWGQLDHALTARERLVLIKEEEARRKEQSLSTQEQLFQSMKNEVVRWKTEASYYKNQFLSLKNRVEDQISGTPEPRGVGGIMPENSGSQLSTKKDDSGGNPCMRQTDNDAPGRLSDACNDTLDEAEEKSATYTDTIIEKGEKAICHVTPLVMVDCSNEIGVRRVEDDANESSNQQKSVVDTTKLNSTTYVPSVGMEFDDDGSAEEFYNSYALRQGFSVRVQNSRTNKHGLLMRKALVCSKEGFPRSHKEEVEVTKKRSTTRCGCNARIILKRAVNGKLYVAHFEPDHNHELATPSKARTLRSHRKMTNADLKIKAGIRTKAGYTFLGEEAGGCESLALLPIDCKNCLRTKCTSSLTTRDAGAMMQYLESKSANDPFFFSSMQLDSEGFVTNIFWADGKSRLDYEVIGDVICLDTTYQINDSGRPFALFIGVNHHKQNIIFGAALLYNQTTEAFEWLFQSFEKAMKGRRPKVILTDQSEAMETAIANIWEDTHHRLCIWHIHQNASVNLSHLFNKNGFEKDFRRCLLDCDDEDSFLSAWNHMLEKHDLVGNEWLEKLFRDKEKWALAYGRHKFSADIISVQRNENIHRVLKGYLNSDMNLSSFLEYFERLLEDRREAELQLDCTANQSTPILLCNFLLKEAAKVYTPNVFEKFREEALAVADCDVDYLGEDGNLFKYKVTMVESVKEYFVVFEATEQLVSCSCKKFEFVGILCRHTLKVLDHMKIKRIPKQYILKRWTKEAKSGIMHLFQYSADGNYGQKLSMETRYDILCHALVKIAARASGCDEAYKYVHGQSGIIMNAVEKELKNMKLTTYNGVPQVTTQT